MSRMRLSLRSMFFPAAFVFGLFVASMGLFAISIPAHAQEGIPAISETQRLQIANISQALELAQLRAQLAQRDFDQARERLRVLLLQLERPGYVFDVQTMTYRAVADAPKP